MNETFKTGESPEVPWMTSGSRVRVPDTSMLPGSEKAPPAAVASLNRAANTAHDAVDRFADSAASKVTQLGDSVAGAGATLRDGAEHLGRVGEEWAESLRTTVRTRPLVAMAAAVTLGALIVRLTRR